jgi:hypothetical protein
MAMKYSRINKEINFHRISPILYIFILITKAIFLYLKTPGAQGGTGGW